MSDEDFIVKSPIAPVPIYDGDLATVMWGAMETHGEKQALVNSATGDSYTYNGLKQAAEHVASHLLQLGVSKGCIVTLYSTNCLEYVVMVLAVWRIGGVVALINYMSTPADLNRELNRLKSPVMFTNDKNVHKAIKGSQNTSVKAIISTHAHPSCLSFTSLASQPLPTPLPGLSQLTIQPMTDTAAILFSSGTTGLPKAVQLTHRNINAEVAYITLPELESPRDTYLVFQPLAHIYGCNMLVSSIVSGAQLVIMPAFNLEQYVQLVAKYKVTMMALVPPVSIQLIKSGLLQQYDLSCVHSVKNAAAPMSPEVEQELDRQLGGNIHFKQTFGMTETNGMIVGIPGRHHTDIYRPLNPGSVGILMPDCFGKIVDPNTNKAQGPNKVGEMCFRSPTNMKGYLGDAEATSIIYDAQGWLHTGDIGYYDVNGCFYIVDRMKDIIKYNAMQVSPSELEAVILTNTEVADVCVMGFPDPLAGELPMAWVVKKPGRDLTQENIVDFVAERVAPYKRLRGGVQFINEIPKSASGKILRNKLKQSMSKKELLMSKL